jgi:hypothetical protein
VSVRVDLLDALEANRGHGYPLLAPDVNPATMRR